MIGLLLLVFFSAAAMPSANAYESITVPIVHPVNSATNFAANSPGNSATTALVNSRVVAEKPKSGRLEFAASSWAPRDFQSTSNVATEGFQTSMMPSLSLSYSEALRSYRLADISWKAGVGYLGMSRSSTAPSAAQLEAQSLYLFSGNIGADLKPVKLRYKELSPYVSASLMPTIAVVNRAVQNEGSSTLGVPLQFSIGSTIGSRWTGYAALRDLEFNLAVVKTLDGIGQSGFSGTGLLAGIRFMNF